MKKLWSKTLKDLIMTSIDQCMSEKKFGTRRNLFVLQYKNIDKVEIFDALHDKIALRRREK